MIGTATFNGTTNVDSDKHMVVIFGIKVTNTYFPSLDEASSAKMDQLFKTFVPEVVTISLERVVAYMPKPQSVQAVSVKNDPPFIFVNYSPAILLAVDGEPVLAAIPNTELKFVVNTQWAVFLDTSNRNTSCWPVRAGLLRPTHMAHGLLRQRYRRTWRSSPRIRNGQI